MRKRGPVTLLVVLLLVFAFLKLLTCVDENTLLMSKVRKENLVWNDRNALVS